MDRIGGTVQPYAWGDPAFIADLQGRPPTGTPEAELWFGAHPVAPSPLLAPDSGAGHDPCKSDKTLDAPAPGPCKSDKTLADAIAADADSTLGPPVARRFGQLPFLLKVLAAAQPLSIQAHPSLDQARTGFAREDAAGIAWDSPTRTYRDPNHKPELICALTRFEAKCGFRPLAASQTLVTALAAASPRKGTGTLTTYAELLTPDPASTSEPATILRHALRWLFDLPPAAAQSLVADTVAAAHKLSLLHGHDDSDLASFAPELAWTAELNRYYPGDIGVVVALLLNHVVLEPGQAMFLGAGNLHAYLRGAGVELMANSDNVVRGGLTPKHLDVAELLSVVDTTPALARIQTPATGCHRFDSPVSDFSLTRIVGPIEACIEPSGGEIVLVTSGSATVTVEPDTRNQAPGVASASVSAGEAVFMSWLDRPYRLRVPDGTTVWRAGPGTDC